MRAVTMVLFLAVAARAGKENLVENGGFEKGMDGWVFIDNSGNTKQDLDRQVKKEGGQSLHLKKTGGPPFDVLRTDLGALRAGGKVSVTASFKAQGVQNGWLKIFFYDKSGETIEQGADVKSLAGTYDWKEIKISNDVPKGTASAAIFMLIVQPGELWIDEVRVTGAPADPPKKKKSQPLDGRIPKRLDAKTRVWLDRNAIQVKTLEFGAGTGDLERLKPLLERVRIVQLGEQSHMDGASFRAKARLARFLHEEMGFDVIAFESGLYECEKANGLLAEGKGKAAMHASIFGIWRVEEALALFEYMASKKTLRLSGFDTRGSGAAATEFFPDLYQFLKPAGEVSAADQEALAVIDGKLNGHPYDPTGAERDAAHAALGRVRKLFDDSRAKLVEKHGEPETEFFSRSIDNYLVRERFEFAMTQEDKDLPGNMRDEQMAKNLQWLADVRYPDKKILTWAATSHQAHNLTKVKIGGSSEQYERWKNMGQYVHDWYGEKVFTIGFAALEGKAGRFAPMFDLAEPKEGSFEDLLGRYGHPLVFVPLRGESPFEAPMFCSPMSYDRSIEAPWPQVLDALFFTREMTPTKWVPAD